MALQIVRRRFTVDEYYRMADVGILHEDDRVELIDGEIVEITPVGPGHVGCVIRLTHHFGQRVGDAGLLSVHNPVRLDEHNEPEPDVALLRPRADFYADAHPGPGDVLLLVEVADSSAAYDRRVKLPLYARFGIREVWQVDLNRGVVRVHRDPGPSGYRTARTVRRGERLAPLAFPDCELAVADILGGEEGGR
jgi:Uma2 family endonuclease